MTTPIDRLCTLPSADAAARLMTPNAAGIRAQAAFHLEGAFKTVIAPAARKGRTSVVLAFDIAQVQDAAELASNAGYSVTLLKWRGKSTGRIQLVWPERPRLPMTRPYPRRSPIRHATDPECTFWWRMKRWLGVTSPD
ncbi:hypothetical protein [Deinococcus sp. QL22]|uniref:hypothetical protein n=1 Tax=Deinococcus sp. QL22 TaxID=2939437 RepID=UPI002016C345|nr:hypothetical protein [Deinococcus sp. QL22]UQN10412.1 hypothetical protein M1R55_30120 [Deinococcus sp. QL22]UQN10546.1 hypothetical protein M1R55_29445 [Deinococcus sp. QL22]